MAWISVHEQVLGGKLRSLANELRCSQNEVLGLLVRFWLWGINNADEDGRIESATKDDVADVMNIGIDKRISPSDAVDAMIATRWIDFDNGCLYIHDWKEWQKQWYKALKVREADNERKAKERAKIRDAKAAVPAPSKRLPEQGGSKVSTDGGETNPPSDSSKKLETGYSTEFEEFWQIYPRKIGKGDAYKCYKARLHDGWRPSDLVEAARRYAMEVSKKHTEKEYIKHPKTFLSSTTPFADFIKKGEPASHVNDDDPYADWRR